MFTSHVRIGFALAAALALPGLAQAAPPAKPPLGAWLRGVYGKAAQWGGDWTGKATVGKEARGNVTHSVCGDSGTLADGTRFIVVCLSGGEGHVDSGSADLFVVEGNGAQARTRSEWRDVGSSMGYGNSDDVSFMDIGPGKTGMLLSGRSVNQGVGEDYSTLYIFDGKAIRQAFGWDSGYSDSGGCSGTEAQCARTETDVTCKLVADHGHAQDGFYPLSILVDGKHQDRKIHRAVPVAQRQGEFTAPDRKALAALGCAYSR